MGCPSNSTSPLSARSTPATMFNKVDLPHPDGPTTTTNSPAVTSSEMPSTAVVSWREDTKRRDTSRSERSGAGVCSDARAAVAGLERVATISVHLDPGKVLLRQHLVEEVEGEELGRIGLLG